MIVQADSSLKCDEQDSSKAKSDNATLLDPLLARLSDNPEKKQHTTLAKQKGSVRSRGGPSMVGDSTSQFFSTVSTISSPSDPTSPLSPLTDLSSISDTSFGYKGMSTPYDVSRMQAQMHSGPSKHLSMNDDRNNFKLAKHSMDQVHGYRDDMTEQTITNLQRSLNSASSRTPMTRTEVWPFDDPTADQVSDAGDPMVMNYNRQSTIWSTGGKPSITQLPAMPLPSPAEMQFANSLSRTTSIDHGDYFSQSRNGWNNNTNRRSSSFQPGPAGPPVSGEARMYGRRPSFNSTGSNFTRAFEYSMLGHQPSPTSYSPSPIGTPLSPTATEFTTSSGNSAAIWNNHGHVCITLLYESDLVANIHRMPQMPSRLMSPQLNHSTIEDSLNAVSIVIGNTSWIKLSAIMTNKHLFSYNRS